MAGTGRASPRRPPPRPSAGPDRFDRAANFVTTLQAASRRNPGSWRPVASIGRAAGIEDPAELAMALRDAVNAGVVFHRVDDGHVLLTDKGRLAAATPIKP